MKNYTYNIDKEANMVTIYGLNGEEFKTRLNKDSYGNEYFLVPNFFTKNKFTRFSFNGRIEDAIKTIRNGDGDAIFKTIYNRVVHFVNRDIGERMRVQSLLGWENSKFVTLLHIPGLFGGMVYGKNDKFVPFSYSKIEDLKVFNSDDEAYSFIEKLQDKYREFLYAINEHTISSDEIVERFDNDELSHMILVPCDDTCTKYKFRKIEVHQFLQEVFNK